MLILRQHQTQSFRAGSKASLSINPEQTPGFRPGIVEGLHWFYRHLSFSHHKKEGFNKALTLIELLLAIAILGILSAIAVPIFTDYMNDSRNAAARADITNIESQIERFASINRRPPNTLGEAGIVPPLDPWGNSYTYLRIAGLPPGDWQGLCRRDQSFNPLNADYDLYSNGADGLTVKNIGNADSADDIIRANNGAYIGLASEY